MSGIVRAGMTETRNAYRDMPSGVSELGSLANRLDDVRSANVEHHVELCAAAAAEGVQLLGLGELFPGPYFALTEEPFWRDLAEDAQEGPTITTMRAAAKEHALVLVAPIYELDSSTGRRFNTAVVIDECGEVLGKYRKTHIPAGTNERASFHETYYYERGDGQLGNGPANISKNPHFPVFQTSLGLIGIATCYDRHFAGCVRSLAANGAQIVLSPAVTFGEKSRRMWDLEFPVDAARHNLYIGGSNRRGAESPWDVEYFGASYWCGPGGRLSESSSHPNLVVADLDIDALEGGDPSGWNLPRDERPEIYSR